MYDLTTLVSLPLNCFLCMSKFFCGNVSGGSRVVYNLDSSPYCVPISHAPNRCCEFSKEVGEWCPPLPTPLPAAARRAPQTAPPKVPKTTRCQQTSKEDTTMLIHTCQGHGECRRRTVANSVLGNNWETWRISPCGSHVIGVTSQHMMTASACVIPLLTCLSAPPPTQLLFPS